jgi:hypothetical protein
MNETKKGEKAPEKSGAFLNLFKNGYVIKRSRFLKQDRKIHLILFKK